MQPGVKPPQHKQLLPAGHKIPPQSRHVQRKPELSSLAPPSRSAGAQLQVGVASTQNEPLQVLTGQTAEPSAHVWQTPTLGQSASLVHGRVGAPPAPVEPALPAPPRALLSAPTPALLPAVPPALLPEPPATPGASDGCSRLTLPAQATSNAPPRLDSASTPSANFWARERA